MKNKSLFLFDWRIFDLLSELNDRRRKKPTYRLHQVTAAAERHHKQRYTHDSHTHTKYTLLYTRFTHTRSTHCYTHTEQWAVLLQPLPVSWSFERWVRGTELWLTVRTNRTLLQNPRPLSLRYKHPTHGYRELHWVLDWAGPSASPGPHIYPDSAQSAADSFSFWHQQVPFIY